MSRYTNAQVREFTAAEWERHFSGPVIDWSDFTTGAVGVVRDLAAGNGDHDLYELAAAEYASRQG